MCHSLISSGIWLSLKPRRWRCPVVERLFSSLVDSTNLANPFKGQVWLGRLTFRWILHFSCCHYQGGTLFCMLCEPLYKIWYIVQGLWITNLKICFSLWVSVFFLSEMTVCRRVGTMKAWISFLLLLSYVHSVSIKYKQKRSYIGNKS